MKSSYGICVLAALVFSVIAWLISLLLSDHLFPNEFNGAHNDAMLSSIQDSLNEEPANPAIVQQIEEEYDLSIRFIEFEDSSGQVNSNDESADLNEALSTELVLDDSVGYDLYDLVLDDGRVAEVAIPFVEELFFTPREWFYLAMQCLAAIAAVFFTISVMNNRLKVLDGATRDVDMLGLSQQLNDPVEKAVLALNHAKQSIVKLGESQKSSAADHRDLLASVAHEFRNPLARLQFANEMAMERTGDEQKALFEEANIAAVELDELVRETLRYSRISSLDSALSIESLSVEDVFRDIANTVSTSQSNVALRIQYPDNDYVIQADRRLFTRALSNLVVNGLRYANSEVTLSVRQTKESFVFNVKDDGDGIATIHHDKLFEPFYRVERSRSRDTGGFGLGLSIVKSVCDRHSALVSVQSDNNGTCFTIEFPDAQS